MKNIINDLIAFAQLEANQLCDWWSEKMIDEECGGFLPQINNENIPELTVEKSIILNSRILWTFSNASIHINSRYKNLATRAYEYIFRYFWDDESGGLYWSLNRSGQVIQSRKQIYAQAFGIYGLVAYYRMTKHPDVLDQALHLFDLIEAHSLDSEEGGYIEAFSKDWEPIEDLRLSDQDLNEAKTMNTHLHILEAYTALKNVTNSQKVTVALRRLINYFLEYFIDSNLFHLHLFFDHKWKLKSNIISYGHDIETSWLICEAGESLKNETLGSKLENIALQMTDEVLANGTSKQGGIYNERKGTHLDNTFHWWPQSEAVVGFINAFQLSNDSTYLNAALNTVQFIKDHQKDHKYGEWYWSVDANLKPVTKSYYKAGPWKAPYHNVRMCLEILSRLQEV